MKYIVIAAVLLLVLIALVFITGMLVPRTHRASVQVAYKAPPERVFAAIRDVEQGPQWRTGLKKVERLSAPGEPLRWRETAEWGTITFVRDVEDAPRRIVARIADEDQGFGGTWTYEVAPTSSGSTLRITEDGVIDSALFRFIARFVMGYYKTLEVYARDLGRHLGEEVQPERLQPG